MAISNFRLSFDLFSRPFYLNFSKKKKRYSSVGILMSLILIGYLLYQFSQSDLFRRQNPIVVRETIETAGESTPITFNDQTLITLHVSDRSNIKYIDPTIFTLNFRLYFVRANEIKNQMEQVYVIDQHLVPCTMKHVSFDPSLYTSLDLNNSFCLTNGTFQLKGYLNELTNYYAASELYICNNATSVVPINKYNKSIF